MPDNLFHLFTDPWQMPTEKISRNNNKYVCLCGNSGAGKSSGLTKIAKEIYKHDNKTIAIDEKKIHHPFLKTLFYDTKEYGLQVQLNFMIQRSLLVKNWFDCGYSLVMERSHLDDRVFIKHLFNEGCVNKEEYDAYISVWKSLAKRLPNPDAIIFLDLPPEQSIARITQDEDSGLRPREFPTEEKKQQWLNAWYKLYVEFYKEMQENNQGIKVFRYEPSQDFNQFAKQVTQSLKE